MSNLQKEILLKVLEAEDIVKYKIDNYMQAAINMIIDKGHVNPITKVVRWQINNLGKNPYPTFNYDERNPIDYYGSRLKANFLLTREALKDIIASGVNYKLTTDPSEETGDGFNGTFCEESLKFNYLECQLITGSGNLYIYTFLFDDGFAALIKVLSEYKDKDVREIAQSRIDNLTDQYGQPINWDWVEKYQKFDD